MVQIHHRALLFLSLDSVQLPPFLLSDRLKMAVPTFWCAYTAGDITLLKECLAILALISRQKILKWTMSIKISGCAGVYWITDTCSKLRKALLGEVAVMLEHKCGALSPLVQSSWLQ